MGGVASFLTTMRSRRLRLKPVRRLQTAAVPAVSPRRPFSLRAARRWIEFGRVLEARLPDRGWLVS
jgi:hypothetical protein